VIVDGADGARRMGQDTLVTKNGALGREHSVLAASLTVSPRGVEMRADGNRSLRQKENPSLTQVVVVLVCQKEIQRIK